MGKNRCERMGKPQMDKESLDMISELRGLMEDAPDERTRQEFQRLISKMENM